MMSKEIKYLNDLDMSKMSLYEIVAVFSKAYSGHDFVWEKLDDGSIQIYTMIYPTELDTVEKTKEGWKFWNSIEVYTKNFKSDSNDFAAIEKHIGLQIKKGLI